MESTNTTDVKIISSENLQVLNTGKTALNEGAVVDDNMSPQNSEYDSADSYSDQEQNVKVRSRASDQDDNSDAGGSIILEREEGDGQESVPAKRVDDDEDKKNPQYIPKRGTFYEHDDRTAEDVEAEKIEEAEKDKDSKKKVWQDKKEKWSHDRFNESEQAPKSKSELVNIYGYDIRNEEGPPRARRRRRYGRGPNKYTRNWEDEDAYNKPAPKVTTTKTTKKQHRPKKNTEEFPPLVNTETETAESTSQQSNQNENISKSEERIETPPREVNSPQYSNEYINNNVTNAQEIQNNKSNQRIGSGRVAKPKKEIKDSDYRGFTAKTRLQRNLKGEQQKVLPPRNQVKADFIQTQNFTNKNTGNNSIQEMEKEMSKLSVDGIYKGGKQNNQRQGSVPPRLQSEQQKGSKRYSSIRQRSLPESNTPPVGNYQPAAYYQNEYNQQAPPPTSQTLLHPAATQMPPPLPPTLAQQVQAPASALLQAGPPFPPAAFLQAAGVAPPTAFITTPQAPPPQVINFVAAAQPAFAPAGYQTFQQPFNAVVTQPTELYQPQGGITYYSTDQQVAQRPVPQKRPKAAIPIVAPPNRYRKEDEENNTNTFQTTDSTVNSELVVEQQQ